MDYIEDVKNCDKDKELTVSMNGGLPLFDQRVRLIFLPFSVHVNENYLTKIISLKGANNIPGVRVTMNTLI